MAKASSKPFRFEEALGKLETLVESLEEGNLSLEDSLKAFEQGINLTRQCQSALDQAEQTVQQLLENGNDIRLEPFGAGDSDPA